MSQLNAIKLQPIKKEEESESNSSEPVELLDELEESSEVLDESVDEQVDALQAARDVVPIKADSITSWKTYPLYCLLCPYSTLKHSMLTAHVTEKHAKEINDLTKMKYQCADCKKMCSTYCKFLIHVREHHPILKLCCDICSEYFETYKDLSKHHLEHKGSKNFTQPLVRYCTHCPKVCPTRIVCNKHILTHDGALECQVCEKSFKCLKYLKRHMEQHDDSKFSCDYCGKTFARHFNKISHERTHTGEKPYTCDKCGQRFSFSSTWKNHLRTHTGEKTYKCEECDVSFRHYDSLKEHKRTHTNEMPYKCIPCDKDFRFRKSLNRHMQEAHTIRPGVKNKTLPLKKRPTENLNATEKQSLKTKKQKTNNKKKSRT